MFARMPMHPAIPHCSTGTAGPCWYATPVADINDTESSTAETVAAMYSHIEDAAADPYFQSVARQARTAFAQAFGVDAPAIAAFMWCKAHMRFVPDEVTLNRLLGRNGELDFLQSPSIIVRSAKPEGDCDCFTMCLLAMLRVFGQPYRICTVKCQASQPWRWSHVYGCTTLENGDRLGLDASHGKYPGWEVPAGEVFEYAEWDTDGRRLPTSMRPMPMGAYRLAPRARRRRGLGDDTCGGDPDCLAAIAGITPGDIAALNNLAGQSGPSGGVLGGTPTGSYGYYDQFGNFIVPGANGYTSTNSTGSMVVSGGASSTLPTPAAGQIIPGSNAIANDVAAVLNQVTKTVGGIVSPQVTYRLANGTLVTAPAGSVAGAQIVSTATGGISSTVLLIGGVLLVGALFMGGHR